MVALITGLIGRGLHRFGHRVACLGKRMEKTGCAHVASRGDAVLADRVTEAIRGRFGHVADRVEVCVWSQVVHLRGCVPEEWHRAIIEFARQVEPQAEIIDELEYCTPVT